MSASRILAPRVVLFDLDDTLFAHRAAVDGAIEQTRVRLGLTGDAGEAAEAARWTQLEELHYHRYLAGELDYVGQRRARVHDFLEPYGIRLTDAEAEAWFEDYLAGYRARFVLHDGALPCLDALEQRLPGVRFGIVTNGDEAFQTAKLAALGITDRIEHLVSSGAFGVVKPDPRIFRYACDRFGVRAQDAVMVGDRLGTDALGAARAGLGGVWLNRIGVVPTDAERTEAEEFGVRTATTLTEVASLLTQDVLTQQALAARPEPASGR
ncbi:HAD family hydrolase [uncultured Amnibacterium sp.]|uniref:HAD family hydrolase n=1 Tax=uncultured Amnibacterium sp. TaxID=1631851 RepID=UPI0035C9754C